MKLCVKCGVEKPLSAFHRRGSGQQAWCKECRKEYDAAYFRAERPRVMARKRQRWLKVVEWHNKLKESIPCADCGGHFHHAAMAWDHLPGNEKQDDVSNLRRVSKGLCSPRSKSASSYVQIAMRYALTNVDGV